MIKDLIKVLSDDLIPMLILVLVLVLICWVVIAEKVRMNSREDTIIQAIQTGHACARAGLSKEMCIMQFKKHLEEE